MFMNVLEVHAGSVFTGHLKMEAVYSDQPDYMVQYPRRLKFLILQIYIFYSLYHCLLKIK